MFLLVDIRHTPTENDKIMFDWIMRNGYEPILIATKLDKIKRSQGQKQMTLLKTSFHGGEKTIVIPFSAQTKQGRDEIYEILDEILQGEEM